MRPVRFKGVNATLTQPEDWDDDKHGPCEGLPVMDCGDCIASCWRPSWRERLVILLGGGVYLWVVGDSQPPIAIDVYWIKKE